MVRDFGYKGEVWRVAAHGIAGREDRMTEPNDTGAPLEDIIVMLCDRLIDDRAMTVSDPNAPFAWDTTGIRFMVHDGVRAFARG
jgi:hypothetical protein